MPDRSARPAPRPLTLVVAVVLLALQVGAFAALAVAVAASPGGADEGARFPVVVFATLAAVLLAVVTLSLWRLRRWARGPAVAWSILMVLTGFSQLGVNVLAAIAVIVIGLVGAVTAAAPATRLALEAATESRSGQGELDRDAPSVPEQEGPPGRAEPR